MKIIRTAAVALFASSALVLGGVAVADASKGGPKGEGCAERHSSMQGEGHGRHAQGEKHQHGKAEGGKHQRHGMGSGHGRMGGMGGMGGNHEHMAAMHARMGAMHGGAAAGNTEEHKH